MKITKLINNFNRQVGNHGRTGMRAYHDQALIDEFQKCGIETAYVYDGKVIRFLHVVHYDLTRNSLKVTY